MSKEGKKYGLRSIKCRRTARTQFGIQHPSPRTLSWGLKVLLCLYLEIMDKVTVVFCSRRFRSNTPLMRDPWRCSLLHRCHVRQPWLTTSYYYYYIRTLVVIPVKNKFLCVRRLSTADSVNTLELLLLLVCVASRWSFICVSVHARYVVSGCRGGPCNMCTGGFTS